MDTLKKWLPTGLLAIGGILGLALGFAAAFGNAFIIMKVNDLFTQVNDNNVGGVLGTHVKIAFIGGIVAGVLGILSLGASAFVGYKAFNGELEGNTAILVSSIVTFVIVFAIAVAAIVCQSDLNSSTWIMKNAGQIGKALMKQH